MSSFPGGSVGEGALNDSMRSLRPVEAVPAKGNRGQGVRHMLRVLESVGQETQGERPVEEGPGGRVHTAVDKGARTERTQAPTRRAAENLVRRARLYCASGLDHQMLGRPVLKNRRTQIARSSGICRLVVAGAFHHLALGTCRSLIETEGSLRIHDAVVFAVAD